MLQIIGKGGMARELASYVGYKTKMAEYEEIQLLDKRKPTVIAIGNCKTRENLSILPFNYAIMELGKNYNTTVLDGSILCPGSVVTCNVHIGKHVIINVNAAVHHDSIIGSFSTISPGATICGSVLIGRRCFIGANAVVREKIKICDDVVIGAGSVVVKDITEPGIYAGNPCKKIK